MCNKVILLGLLLSSVDAHTRLSCPPPRSDKTGVKKGPCDAPDNPDQPAYPLQPGLNTIWWEESIGHPGAPGRVALSLDGRDEGFEDCVLLDHIPHDAHSKPQYGKDETYARLAITIWVPDIKCERCNLQFLTFMTDHAHGLPEGEKCVYEGAQAAGKVDPDLPSCDAVYHSCAPVSINGTVPRDDHTCSLPEAVETLKWPFMEGKPPASTYLFRGDPGVYSEGFLQSSGVPMDKTCKNLFYCDPSEFYTTDIEVPEDALYTKSVGECANWYNENQPTTATTPIPSNSTNSAEEDPTVVMANADVPLSVDVFITFVMTAVTIPLLIDH